MVNAAISEGCSESGPASPLSETLLGHYVQERTVSHSLRIGQLVRNWHATSGEAG
jgi:hypothetical protein